MPDLEVPVVIAEAEELPQFTEAQAEAFTVAAPSEEIVLDDGVSESSSDGDDPPPAVIALEPESTIDEIEVLSVAPLSIAGDTAIYRVTGPLTFARIMALERALAGLGGVTLSSVKPESAGEATVSFVSADPETTIDNLLNVPGLAIRKARS
jgi:hypothetical protein